MRHALVVGTLMVVAPTPAHAEEQPRGIEASGTLGLGVLWGSPVCEIVSDEESCSGVAAATLDFAAVVRLLPWIGVGARGSYGAFAGAIGSRSSDGWGYDMAKHPGRWVAEARFYLPGTQGWDGWLAAGAGAAHVTRTVNVLGAPPPGAFVPSPSTTWGPDVGVSAGASVGIAGPVIGGFHLGADKVWLARKRGTSQGVTDYGNPIWVTFGIEAGFLLPL